ncbi:phospholipase D family protein [Ruegeria profundi]|uniref:phospholipase D family protein n=1 Tax=Ruegeria profundi TaxID=1685378 RepID=UPI001CD6F6EA|nr:phospholipase D family protein [Ruegeria profundi]MCA0929758.1 phospholipase D family protein [Ruegeria profundi]
MARERADSFISRFLFRGSKEREQETVGVDVELSSPSETVAQNELVWATNGERSVQKFVERTLNGSHALVVTGYQDFLSAMSIILRVRPNIVSEPPETIRIIFGTNTDNQNRLDGSGRGLSEEARDYFLETRGLSLRSLDELRAVLAYDAIASGAISLRIFDNDLARERFGRTHAMLHAKLFISDTGALAGSANFSVGGLKRNLEYVDELQAFPDLAATRRVAAEDFWTLGTDWTEQALEILRALLRPVSAEEALARTVHEMTSFSPWRVGGDGTAGRPPLPFQTDLVYEAAGTAYEHGFAFVEAPTGAGKTDIGKHLATVLPTMHSSVVLRHGNERPDQTRNGALGIIPASVLSNWIKAKPSNLHLIKHSQLSMKKKGDQLEELAEINRDARSSASMIVDESHRLNSRYLAPSRRSLVFEQSPAIWTSCLSATLMGNQGLDGLLAFHERRASIYVPPEITARINDNLKRGRERASELNELRALRQNFEDRQRSGMEDMFLSEADLAKPIEEAEERLAVKRLDPREIQADMADALAPYVVRRQRHCVGESNKRGPAIYAYPEIESIRIDADLTPEQSVILGEIRRLAESISTGTTLVSADPKRAGHTEVRFHDKARIHIRNFLAILRSSITFAREDWERRRAADADARGRTSIGESLRRSERESRSGKTAIITITPKSGELPLDKRTTTPICDRIGELLQSPELDAIDEQRAEHMAEMLNQHRQVIFLSERIGVLEVYARLLSTRKGPKPEVILVAASHKLGSGSGIQVAKNGAEAQEYLALDGKKASDEKRRAMFMTFQMAEGINLQRARALGIVGVTSDIKSMLQGLGRIDRIDSPHSKITYTTFDLPGLVLSSDRKGRDRIESIALLSGVGASDLADEYLEFSAGDLTDLILEQHKKPRLLRRNNLYDLVEEMRRKLPNKILKSMERIKPQSLWGAELCLLAGKSPMTIIALGGRSPSLVEASYLPPRLLAVRETDDRQEIIRDQPEVTRMLREAYGETVKAGKHQDRPTEAELSSVIEGLQPTLEGLSHWDIRPERTVSLLESLDRFLASGPSKNQGYNRFGHLTLPSLEKLAEAWAQELDLYWIEAKKDVSQRSEKERDIPDYLGIDAIYGFFKQQPSKTLSEVRARMEELFGAAEQASRNANTQILDRIAVIFQVKR